MRKLLCATAVMSVELLAGKFTSGAGALIGLVMFAVLATPHVASAECIGVCQSWTDSQIAQAAYSQGFRGGALVVSIAVANAESSRQVNAAGDFNNPNSCGCYCSIGLWQINRCVHTQYTQAFLLDGNNNAQAAYAISNAQIDASWTPWTMFNNGTFQNYLSGARNAASNVDSSVITGSQNRVKAVPAAGYSTLPVRTSAGGSSSGSVPSGAQGTVTDGPTVAVVGSGSYRYVWWKIQWDNGTSGWSAEDYMTRVYTLPPVTNPVMNVRGLNSQSIPNGDTTPSTSDGTDFGNVSYGSESSPITFTIENTGQASLSLTATPKAQITGTNASEFYFTQQPSTPIAPGGTTTFKVVFEPSVKTQGVRNGTVTIANNDSARNPYTFAIRGTIPATSIIDLDGNLAFGNVPVGQSVQRIMTVYNDGNSSLTVSSISYPAAFSGNWSGGTISAGGSQDVTVTFLPGAQTSYGGTITVNSNATNGTNTISVSGTGTTTPTAATPTISPNGGTFTDSVQVTLSTTTSGATIRYTTNGNDPTSSSTQYGGAFTLTSSTTIKARAFKSAYNESNVALASFTIGSPSDTTNPTVAISSPTTGQTFTTSPITVSGTAADPGSPSSGVVLVEVRMNGGTWQTAGGTTTWSYTANLSVGNSTIDARSKDGAGRYSAISSISVTYSSPLPSKATAPSPANGVTGISIAASLGWVNGGNATNYDVYFGTVNPPPFKANQTNASYSPGTLSVSTQYYWRIDAKNSGTTTGDVWSFTTAGGGNADMTAPEVQITSPCASTCQAYVQAITISGTATDSGGSGLQKMIVLNATNGSSGYDVNLSGNSSTFQVTGISLVAGVNQIYAAAFDKAGNESDHLASGASISVNYDPNNGGASDTTPPTVAIAAPTNGQTFTTSSISVSGTATDSGTPSSGVALVEIRVNSGNWMPMSGTSSWGGSVSLSSGSNIIESRSKDVIGNYSTVDSVNVSFLSSDTIPPMVEIVSPSSGQVFTTPSILVSGTAADQGSPPSGVAQIQMRVNSGNWMVLAGTTSWNGPATLVSGSNTIEVWCMDVAGSSKMASVSVTYNPPSINTLTDTAQGVPETSSQSDASTPSSNVITPPLCGYGIVDGFVGMLLGLGLMQTRRHRWL